MGLRKNGGPVVKEIIRQRIFVESLKFWSIIQIHYNNHSPKVSNYNYYWKVIVLR